LLVGCGLLALLAPLLVATVIAPGYDAAKQARIVDLTRIMLLSPLFLGLGGWAQGILNARQHFTLPALAPLVYNGCIILGAVAFTPIWGLEGLAYGVVLGALMHFLIQVPGLARVGMRYHFGRIQPADEGVGEVARLFAPRLVGQGAYQANVIAVTLLASFLPAGRLAAFNYAYQLMLLPFGVVALSLATVIFPTLAEQFGRGALDELRATLGRALRVVTFLMVPAAVGLGLLRFQIVAVVLEFGAFSGQSTMLVADALGWFAWGLVSYGLLEILTRGAYAMHDTRLPVLLAIGSLVINIALAAVGLFVFHTDHSGLAIALAVSTSLEAAALYAVLRQRLGGIEDRRMLRSAAISLLAAVEMGLVLWGVVPILQTVAPDGGTGKLGGLVVLGGAIALGLGTYIVIARLLQAEELAVAWGLVRRRLGGDERRNEE
jgi:putative peptidoglycan lipid II flippase